MARLNVLLLLFVGPFFFSQLPNTIDAAPAADFDISETAKDIKDVASKWWEKAKNLVKSEPTSLPTECTFENGVWDCFNRTTSTDDRKLNQHTSTWSRGLSATNAFAGHLWNSTKETFNEKKLLDKPVQWWKKVKGFFSQATTEKPPTRYWETVSSDLSGDGRYRRESKPFISGRSSDPEATSA